MVWINKNAGALLIALTVCAYPAWPQQPQQPQQKGPEANAPVQPYPAGEESSSKTGTDAGSPYTPSQKSITPDTRPLSGAEQFTLGSEGSHRSHMVASFHFLEIADTNGSSKPTGSTTNSVSLLSGDFGVQRLWSRYALTAAYAGGGALYNTRSDLNQSTRSNLNQSFHQVSLSQRVALRRWRFLLADEASYLPESSFGYSGLSLGTGLDVVGAPTSNLNPLFLPNQSILTGLVRRVSNTVVGEVEYDFSRRSSFTVTGAYGLLHFLGQGLIDNRIATVRTGYNHALTRHGTLGLIYGFNQIAFVRLNSKIMNHSAQLAYGRRVTGRLALELSGGPQITTFRNAPVSSDSRVSGTVGALLRYARIRDSFSLSYFRGISGGSGLFAGADTEQVEAVAARKLSRIWSGSVSFGYGRNEGLREITPTLSNFGFRSWNAGARLGRALGRRMQTHFTYNMLRQNSDSIACITGNSNCGRVFLRHQFGLGVDWTSRQIRID